MVVRALSLRLTAALVALVALVTCELISRIEARQLFGGARDRLRVAESLGGSCRDGLGAGADQFRRAAHHRGRVGHRRHALVDAGHGVVGLGLDGRDHVDQGLAARRFGLALLTVDLATQAFGFRRFLLETLKRARHRPDLVLQAEIALEFGGRRRRQRLFGELHEAAERLGDLARQHIGAGHHEQADGDRNQEELPGDFGVAGLDVVDEQAGADGPVPGLEGDRIAQLGHGVVRAGASQRAQRDDSAGALAGGFDLLLDDLPAVRVDEAKVILALALPFHPMHDVGPVIVMDVVILVAPAVTDLSEADP